MSTRSFFAASTAALALLTLPLSAANAGILSDNINDALPQASAVLSGDYANFDSNRGGNANEYGVSGAATLPLGLYNTHAELDAGYHHLSGNGSDVDRWNTAGSLYWAPGAGRLGATVGYHDFSGNGFGDVTNYGGFAEWWANERFTLAAKAGGFNGNHDSDGYYSGGAVTGYLQPDVALTAAVDYTHMDHFTNETDFTASGEWLVSEEVPVSIYGGYTHSDLSDGAGHMNVVFVGLRIYTDGDGNTTLVDRQRNGTLGWDSSFSPVAFRY